MQVIILVSGIILILIGLIGSVLPFLPGTPLSFAGLLLANYSQLISVSDTVLWVLGILTVISMILDLIMPQISSKTFGSSHYGLRGATIGVFVGFILFPPFGIIVWPMIGAFLGEYIYKKNTKQSIKSALGTLLGFVLGTGFKLALVGVMLWYVVVELLAFSL